MWIPQMFLRSLPYEPQFPGCEDASIPHDGTKQSAARGYRRRGERARRGLEEPRRSAAEAGRATSIWRPAARNQQTILLLSFISIPAHPRVTSSVSDDANDEGPSRSAAMLGCNSAGRIHGWRLSRSRAAAETHHIWRALAPGRIGCAIWGRGSEGSARGSVGELAADWIVSARLTSSAEIW